MIWAGTSSACPSLREYRDWRGLLYPAGLPQHDLLAPGVVFHTDQGTTGLFRAACQRLGVTQSMGRPGSALDNAVIESWHSTLEFELRRVQHFATKKTARAKVSAWIEDYNTHRRHSACQMMSPIDYERALAA
jgi:transposase InsO family protein